MCGVRGERCVWCEGKERDVWCEGEERDECGVRGEERDVW